MNFGIIGSGSWATAIAKILTDNGNTINWFIRNDKTIAHIKHRKHNPQYLSQVYFNTDQLLLSSSIEEVVKNSETLIIAIPSAYAEEALKILPRAAFNGKKIISAIKGILPGSNQLLNEYLKEKFDVELNNYFTILGPCHAEEVASEKLSYLTFSGVDENEAKQVSSFFKNDYINVVTNTDVVGVQYAAILKNIYALGAGIAHGLEYGDNFLSVYIANCAHELGVFIKQLMWDENDTTEQNLVNYATSVYLGDLLVTCYSLYSRNRTFGNMIGKGYSVKAAQLEMNMVAEGYYASKCVHKTNQIVKAQIPVVQTIYEILWEHLPAEEGFKKIETLLR
ncbi:glycerol-3-phosphate dehydrogenase [mine drainage metagenome]|uniref:Glycerol-3-phosphate dehydrogenase n=1 Tax=mine drainage metagenome TaxID=410659 RepID=A0A1J5TEI4_9ZZZZ